MLCIEYCGLTGTVYNDDCLLCLTAVWLILKLRLLYLYCCNTIGNVFTLALYIAFQIPMQFLSVNPLKILETK